LRNFVIFAFLTGAIQSIMSPYPYFAVFGDADDWYSIHRYCTWQLYANGLMQAALFQMYLTTYCEGLSLGFAVITGYQPKPIMLNPLLKSRSPMDFWGKRWNLLVHDALKNGVFKPIRKYHSRTIAVLATFLASGIFHEWLLWAIFKPVKGQTDPITGECISSCYQPVYGSAIVFFLWQALLIAMEITLGRTPIFQQLGKHLPQAIKTLLIICLGIPVAHYFTDSYFRCGFLFPHGGIGLPMILKVR
jgi:hypothetical protein